MIEIGHIYINDYPESAAEWCNTNNAYIEEIEPQNGHRRFEVKAVPAPFAFESHAVRTTVQSSCVTSG